MRWPDSSFHVSPNFGSLCYQKFMTLFTNQSYTKRHGWGDTKAGARGVRLAAEQRPSFVRAIANLQASIGHSRSAASFPAGSFIVICIPSPEHPRKCRHGMVQFRLSKISLKVSLLNIIS